MSRAAASKTRAVTSRDVARDANVSQALVSRAFTGNGRIAPNTRERILKVAVEIGWQPNALAASMVTGDAPLVAVITTRLSFDWRAQVLSHLLSAF
ncbi:MAG: LacI family DNA-binding transcriptional regulator [Candidatus Devosia euplotis]|nr:LacI family DNA-binding transcriptional regulator [Candidatus Devosia euplotis]